MFLFKKKKKNEQPVFIDIGKENCEQLERMAERLDRYKTTGSASVAFGVNNKIVATGICDNPFKLPYDAESDLLNNPINSCIFCKGGKCYYGGECERRKPLVEEK